MLKPDSEKASLSFEMAVPSRIAWFRFFLFAMVLARYRRLAKSLTGNAPREYLGPGVRCP